MERREALKRTAMLLGGVIFAPTAVGVLNGCTAEAGLDWEPEYFSSDQAELISSLSEIIIPETDTPGASEAGVPAFIEEMVFTAYEEDDRDRFLNGLEAFDGEAVDEHGSSFADLAEEQQFALASERNAALTSGDSEENGPPFFLVFKQLTMVGYFTSEVGATQTLRHVKIPGRYDGCVPFEEIGRTWAV